MQCGTGEAHAQFIFQVGVNTERAATWSHDGKICTKVCNAREFLPCVFAPAKGAFYLFAIFDAQQRGYGFNVVMPRHRQVFVVNCRNRCRKRWIVLCVHREGSATRCNVGKQWVNHDARCTFALHNCYKAVRELRFHEVIQSAMRAPTTCGCSSCKKCPAFFTISYTTLFPDMLRDDSITSTPMQPSFSPCI